MTHADRDNTLQHAGRPTDDGSISPDRLRTIIESCHVNFLIGAGTSAPFFRALGNIEDSLTELADIEENRDAKLIVRASIQAYFFKHVVLRNLDIINRTESAEKVLTNYATFLRTLNRILLKRHNTLLPKQLNIFTTNIDMLLEVAMEEIGIEFCDGFSGKIRPKFDTGDFGTLKYRLSSRYERRFEIPVFNLLKIHGSAAWRQCKRQSVRPRIYFDGGLKLVKEVEEAWEAAQDALLPVEQRRSQESAPEITSVATLIKSAKDMLEQCQTRDVEIIKRFASKYDELNIVNPDKRKFATTVMNETYYELIRRFANELEKENSVLFVHGFSFRDEHLRDLILRAARTNPTLQVIVFCYSRSGLKSFQELLPEQEIKNANVEFVLPKKLDEDPASSEKDERKISLEVLDADYFAPIVRDKIPEPDTPITIEIVSATTQLSEN